nr:retrovirus-related Pol polyprotein from transposon TNT 1-94 [Tanacetum cinerariifolium]
YSLREVIINGDSSVLEPPAVGTVVPPKTEAQKLAIKNELKAKSTLLLAIPDEHLLKFHSIKDAKSIWEAIKIRFGGNEESKKMHKTILNQLELNGKVISQEDANMKLLRSLPLAWNNIALIMRNKPDIETLCMDDLYNNLKVYEDEIKGQSSSGSNSHNVTFVSFENTSNINENVTTAHDISAAGLKEQPYASSYADDIDTDDLEEMDLKWQVAMITMRGNRSAKNEKRVVPVETPASALVVQDGLVPPPYTGNYMPPRADLSFAGLDDSMFKFKISETRTSVNENESITFKSSEETREEHKTVRSNAPIIKDWESDSEDECEDKNSTEQEISSNDNAVKTVECTNKYIPEKHTNNHDENLRKSVNHLIKDYTFYDNKMVEKSVVNNKGKGSGQREVRLVWNNARMVNHQNFSKMTHPHPKRNFVPTAVATKSGQVLVNAAKQNSSASTSTARPKSFLTEYQEIDGIFVALGGSPKGGQITRKDKIRTGKLDFEDVYFVKELKFNLFSISQMCDQKNSILFTENECLVLSSDFKLLDESQVLLKVPRQNNMYSFDLNNVIPSRDLTCLFAKATIDESNLWHRRLGHINFKTFNKLVRGNLAEVVNTTCYVQNRVLVTKPHNKTPYELLIGRLPNLEFMKPFGCPVTILNTLDHLGKFDGKADEGFLVGYFVNSKVFRVFNSRTRKVEENLHVNFLDNKPNVAGRQASQEKAAVHEYILLPFISSTPPLSLTIQSSYVNAGDQPGDVNAGDQQGDVNAGDIQGHARRASSIQASGFARIEAIRLFLAYASFKDFIVYQMDVKSTFLYGTIEEEVYVCQPPGFEDTDFPNIVYKVKKALYGSHQALRAWYETLPTYLLNNGFKRGQIDKTLFIKRNKGDILLVQVYVDDIIFGSTKKEMCLQVKQKQDGLFISQDKYVAEILKKFGFSEVKTASTPMETSKPLLKDKDGQEVDVHIYRSMIGSLMYLTSSRPDIMFTVCACARHQVSPKVTYLHAVKKIFRYLKGQHKLEKPAESAGFEQIINFLKSKPIHYDLTVNPTIYVSCVKRFWATAKVKKVNDQEQIQALVDKTKVIITEESIRTNLYFDDAAGTACLFNEEILKGLARMGTMAYAIICLADNQKFNFSKYIFDNMVKSLEGGVKFYLFPRFLQVFLDKQVEGMARHKDMYVISSHNKKIFTNMRRIGAGFSGVVTPLFDSMMPQKPRKKQRKEAEVSIDESEDEDHVPTPSSDPLPSEISLDDETQRRINDDEMFGVDDLAGEVVVETTIGVKDSATPTTDVTKDEIIMAQALAALKSVKPKVVAQEQEMSTTIPAAATIVTTTVPTPRAKGIVFHKQEQSQIPTVSSSKDKGKAKMIELEVPLKKKEQMRIDEEYARKLQAKEQEASSKRKEEFSKVQKARLEMRKVNHFIVMDSEAQKSSAKEAQESSTKRTAEHLKFDISKKQKVNKNVKPVIDDSEELRTCIEIVPDDGDEVLIEATPLSSRSPTIIDYKIHKEGKKTYFKIIRADGNSQVYQTFEKMFKNFNREDLEVLWAIVKDRFKNEKPVDDIDNIIFRTLKTMFEYHVEDTIWNYQQGLAKVKNWKLFESSGVYCITMQSIIYYLLVEKVYPFTRNTLHPL